MKAAAALALALVMGAAPAALADPNRIVIASDSTAADYSARSFPQMGWGMVLKCSLTPDAQIVNLARGGRSTKTFQEEGLWSVLMAQLKPDDTVLIQFGHNDADTKKIVRFTDPNGAYADNLRRFVADVRTAGAKPVLITPIAKLVFKDGQIQDTHGPYSATVRRVAAETKTPLIDLDKESQAALQKMGEAEGAKRFMIYSAADKIASHPEGINDTTHPNELGARMAAGIVAKGLKGAKVPASKLVLRGEADASARGEPTCAAHP
ncbi:rhamnogalacturonan acetylesterase [Caulobacter endophyticus]|uniref:G-D-S-L family lipolytic protein n=1 Tax=Caulobacter endophyticus TaxID=2172652 RepID=A0A2T9KCR9_9CAUL|nr:rhamnogalacturonan acetylesterase [Caulobacter endophyticus]PVM93764.1 G-D-S-L family lipolytic protein [Caulobacter endophyticus]